MQILTCSYQTGFEEHITELVLRHSHKETTHTSSEKGRRKETNLTAACKFPINNVLILSIKKHFRCSLDLISLLILYYSILHLQIHRTNSALKTFFWRGSCTTQN